LACSYTRWDFDQFDHSQQERVASDIADFLSQLHAVYSLEDLESLAVTKFDYAKEVADVARESEKFAGLDVPQKLKNFVLAQAEVSKSYLSQKHEEVLLHNDLHSSNIILDCDDKSLHGVIDFDDMKLGHFHLDFASLVYSLPASISKNILQKYSTQTGRSVSLAYALAIAVDYVSSNLIKFPENKALWQESLDTLEYLNQF
jgi:aminoglycoside phosphotransferase (APT) family kinase protein